MDGTMGTRLGVLPKLRKLEDKSISEQQPGCGFFLRFVQRRIRVKESEEQIRQ
jgi:hypothetical protein